MSLGRSQVAINRRKRRLSFFFDAAQRMEIGLLYLSSFGSPHDRESLRIERSTTYPLIHDR